MCLISAYAPTDTSSYSFEDRQAFYADLHDFVHSQRVHGPTFTLGDFNARLHFRRPTEETYIGPGVFGDPTRALESTSNRELLMELCYASEGVLINTFYPHDADNLVTYRGFGIPALAEITHRDFAQLDHIICPFVWIEAVLNVYSERSMALQTQHFPLTMELSLEIPRTPKQVPRIMPDLTMLKYDSGRNAFCTAFLDNLADTEESGLTPNYHAKNVASAMQQAASHLTCKASMTKRPWISEATLMIIERRNMARCTGDHKEELQLNKLVKQSAKADRRAWLNEALENGDWSEIRKLKQPPKHRQGRLRDLTGALVNSEERAETLAEYLEKVQWSDHFAEIMPRSDRAFNTDLDIDLRPFNENELRMAVANFKRNKAPGGDAVPMEFWKALTGNQQAMNEILRLCNLCWMSKSIPEAWAHATVVTLFKKGDTSLPSNYRPISLLSVGYKVLASLLLRRLQAGGAEERIQSSQYGFRKHRGTSDALFIARRVIDAALDDKNGVLYMVLLDWSKAFDRIKHTALVIALRRFGLPEPVLQMISGVYKNRTFSVREGNMESTTRPQNAGIAQGCPLSPYLFVIVMSVLLQDARANCGQYTSMPYVVTPELVYADDTMLLASSAEAVQHHFDRVAEIGKSYGLELNLDKTVVMTVRGETDIIDTNGQPLQRKDETVYLGGLLSSNGRPVAELTRRIGEARQMFRKLEAVWKHANITAPHKKRIFDACVVSKLMYGLESVWLLQADRSKLDAFYTGSLRKILGIPHPYISRVSNVDVLKQMNARPLSEQLLARQLQLSGKIGRRPANDLTRCVALEKDAVEPKMWSSRRRVGRPCLRWTRCVHAQALALVDGCSERLYDIICSPSSTAWREHVRSRLFG